MSVASFGNAVKVTNFIEGNVEHKTSEVFLLNGNAYPVFEQLFPIASFPNDTTLLIPHGIQNLYLNYQVPLSIVGNGYDNSGDWVVLPSQAANSIIVSI